MADKVNPLCDYCLVGFYITECRSPVCLNQECRAQSELARTPGGLALKAVGARWMIEPAKFTGPGTLYDDRGWHVSQLPDPEVLALLRSRGYTSANAEGFWHAPYDPMIVGAAPVSTESALRNIGFDPRGG